MKLIYARTCEITIAPAKNGLDLFLFSFSARKQMSGAGASFFFPKVRFDNVPGFRRGAG
jgi:hypothetical protein